jgi:hypothetical protein
MAVHANALQSSSPALRRIPVDAHVHFHRAATVLPTLESAAANFRVLGLPGATPPLGALLLAQSANERVFEWLREQSRVGGWSVAGVRDEPQSLWLVGEAAKLLVVCGRQVVAEPGLEVLALGTDRMIEDGLGLEPTLRSAESAGALPVLPWGFGKWMGRRKQRIREQILAPGVERLWVGDNGGRLRMMPRPSLLDEAEARGFGVLPGSDPFPFGRDHRRAGSFGCLLDVELDVAQPWACLRAALVRIRGSPRAYGQGAGWLGFGFRQAWMQVHKRSGGQSA